MAFDLVAFVAKLDRSDLSKESFVLLFAQYLEEVYGAQNLVFTGDAVLNYTMGNGKEQTFYLDNLWIVSQQGGEPRIDIMDRYAKVAAGNDLGEKTRQNIIPIIKDENFRRHITSERKFKCNHLAGDLWVIYAFDLPNATLTASDGDCDALGIDDQQLQSLALENLRRILPDIQCHGAGPWFLLTAGGDYAASVLLLDGVWEQLAGNVEGELVAVVPCRDVILFTGSSSPEGISALRTKADNLTKNGDHVISGTLLRRTDGAWKTF